MCFPALAPLFSVAGTIASGLAAQQQARYQQRLHELNARASREAAAAEAERFQGRSERALAGRRVAHALSGADPHSGSPLESDIALARGLEHDRLSILHVGEMGAARELAAARYARAQGEGALAGAAFDGARTLLGSLPAWSVAGTPMFPGSGSRRPRPRRP